MLVIGIHGFGIWGSDYVPCLMRCGRYRDHDGDYSCDGVGYSWDDNSRIALLPGFQ